MRNHLVVRPDKPTDDAHADRMYCEMSARRREGDFRLLAPPRALCATCALRAIGRVLAASGEEDRGILLQRTVACVAGITAAGGTPYTAFGVVAEPGLDGRWLQVCPTGDGAHGPVRVYRTLRRDAAAGSPPLDGSGGCRVSPVEPTHG